MKPSQTCYACDDPVTTREHVPPKCFFPKGHRDNLWTVLSCDAHNLDANLDVDYVRNVMSYQYGTNATAEHVFDTSTKRSFDHSPGLFIKTVKGLQEVNVNGQNAGAHPLDLDRIRVVMTAIARALAYRDFGEKFSGKWRVFCATLTSKVPTPGWDKFRALVEDVTYTATSTPHQDVFEYGIHETVPIGFIYRMVFYGGFVVYAWPVLEKESVTQESESKGPAREAEVLYNA